jgi:hypothetical protein
MDALCAAFPVAAGADPVRGRFVYAARDLVPGDVVCAVRRLLVGHRPPVSARVCVNLSLTRTRTPQARPYAFAALESCRKR